MLQKTATDHMSTHPEDAPVVNASVVNIAMNPEVYETVFSSVKKNMQRCRSGTMLKTSYLIAEAWIGLSITQWLNEPS